MTPAGSISLARQLGALAQATRMHDIGNRAVLRTLEGVVGALRVAAAERGETRLEFDGDTFVLDGTLVKLRRDVRAQLLLLVAPLRERGAGGFVAPVDVADRHLVALFHALQNTPVGTTRDELQAAVRANDGEGLTLLAPRVAVTGLVGGPGQSVRQAMSDALRAYLRALVAVQQAIEAGDLATIPAPVFRALQVLTELAEEDPRMQLGLASIRSDAEYRLRHPVNSACLAIALGRRIGLDRRATMDLATATLALAALPSGATSEERLVAASLLVPPDGVLNRSRTRRLLVFLESGPTSSQGDEGAAGLRGPPHLFSRIAALVTAFDERTTTMDRRPAELPDEALAALGEDPHIDAELLGVFSAMLGRWPLGSGVLLDSGDVGVVFHTPSDPSCVDRPVIRLVRDVAGRLLDPAPLVDLGDPSETRRVVRGLDVAAFGIDSHRALYG